MRWIPRSSATFFVILARHFMLPVYSNENEYNTWKIRVKHDGLVWQSKLREGPYILKHLNN